MTAIVVAIHPAHCCRGTARSPIEAMVRMESPVRVREIEARAFGEAVCLPYAPGAPPRMIAPGPGGLWEFVATDAGEPVGRADLNAWLSDIECPEDVRATLDSRFDGTPLASHGNGTSYGTKHARPAYRGDAEEAEAGRRFTYDGREQARLDVTNFLDADVALVGTRLAVRARPVAVIDTWGIPGVRFGRPRAEVDLRMIPARPETFEEAVAGLPRLVLPDPATLQAWSGLATAWPDGLDEVHCALDAWSGPMRGVLAGIARENFLSDAVRAEVGAVRDELRGVEMRSIVGLAGAVSVRGPFDLLSRAVALGIEHGVGRVESLGLRVAEATIRERLSPRVDAALGRDAAADFAL